MLNPEKEKTTVQGLLDFKAKLDRIVVTKCFLNNDKFAVALKDSFERLHQHTAEQAGRDDCQVCLL